MMHRAATWMGNDKELCIDGNGKPIMHRIEMEMMHIIID